MTKEQYFTLVKDFNSDSQNREKNEFFSQIQEDGFMIDFSCERENKIFCIARYHGIPKFKKNEAYANTTICRALGDFVKFRDIFDLCTSRQDKAGLLISHMNANNYCSVVVKHSDNMLGIETPYEKLNREIEDKTKYKHFINGMQKKGFELVIIQDVFSSFMPIAFDSTGFFNDIYKNSKSRCKISQIFECYFGKDGTCFYLFKHKDQKEVSKIRKECIEDTLKGVEELDSSKIMIHSIKEDPEIMQKELSMIFPEKEVFDEFVKIKFIEKIFPGK